MDTEILLAPVKLALRIKSEAFDEDIEDLIRACKKDLQVAGVKKIQDDDPLIKRAVVLYCKGNFGDNDNAVRYLQSYESLKISLCLAGDYLA